MAREPKHQQQEDPASRAMPTGLSPLELAEELNRWIVEALAWSRRQRRRAQAAASLIKLGSLLLAAASTIILGIQDLDFWTGIGFALVATATVLGTIEPFFNWRSRWVLMEEQMHRFHRLQDHLAMRVAGTEDGELTRSTVEGFFDEYSDIWASSSHRWLEFRRGDRG